MHVANFTYWYKPIVIIVVVETHACLL